MQPVTSSDQRVRDHLSDEDGRRSSSRPPNELTPRRSAMVRGTRVQKTAGARGSFMTKFYMEGTSPVRARHPVRPSAGSIPTPSRPIPGATGRTPRRRPGHWAFLAREVHGVELRGGGHLVPQRYVAPLRSRGQRRVGETASLRLHGQLANTHVIAHGGGSWRWGEHAPTEAGPRSTPSALDFDGRIQRGHDGPSKLARHGEITSRLRFFPRPHLHRATPLGTRPSDVIACTGRLLHDLHHRHAVVFLDCRRLRSGVGIGGRCLPWSDEYGAQPRHHARAQPRQYAGRSGALLPFHVSNATEEHRTRRGRVARTSLWRDTPKKPSPAGDVHRWTVDTFAGTVRTPIGRPGGGFPRWTSAARPPHATE